MGYRDGIDGFSRRGFLDYTVRGAGGMMFFGLFGCRAVPGVVRGERLSADTSDLLARCWEGLDPARTVDAHVHLVGMGGDPDDAWVNPEMMSYAHPIKRLRFAFYKRAAGVSTPATASLDYVNRLITLARAANPRPKLLLLALDYNHDHDGNRLVDGSEFFTSNEYLFRVVARDPDIFLPAVSVHPARRDALDRLEEYARMGAVCVKWLPNAMGIDPLDAGYDAYYKKLVALDLPLLTHTGHEAAVEGAASQKFGNPLRLRRPLDLGVKVIAAHCSSLGSDVDLDDAGRKDAASFDLFCRIFSERQYARNFYADISALTQFNRSGHPLRTVLTEEAWHGRLLNGSDYPLPAIRLLTWLGRFRRHGYIDDAERMALTELYRHNPLIADFALKRCLKIVSAGRTVRFPDAVFMPPEGLFRRPAG